MFFCFGFNTGGTPLQAQTSTFNFPGLSWMGDTGQRRELGYTSSETLKSVQLDGVVSMRRREYSGFGITACHNWCLCCIKCDFAFILDLFQNSISDSCNYATNLPRLWKGGRESRYQAEASWQQVITGVQLISK